MGRWWILIWQDLVISIGGLIFILALLPSVFGHNKPAKSTSGITGLVLAVFALTYLTLGLYLTAIVTFVTALIWFTLFLQKAHIESNPEFYDDHPLSSTDWIDNEEEYLKWLGGKPNKHKWSDGLDEIYGDDKSTGSHFK